MQYTSFIFPKVLFSTAGVILAHMSCAKFILFSHVANHKKMTQINDSALVDFSQNVG